MYCDFIIKCNLSIKYWVCAYVNTEVDFLSSSLPVIVGASLHLMQYLCFCWLQDFMFSKCMIIAVCMQSDQEIEKFRWYLFFITICLNWLAPFCLSISSNCPIMSFGTALFVTKLSNPAAVTSPQSLGYTYLREMQSKY